MCIYVRIYIPEPELSAPGSYVVSQSGRYQHDHRIYNKILPTCVPCQLVESQLTIDPKRRRWIGLPGGCHGSHGSHGSHALGQLCSLRCLSLAMDCNHLDGCENHAALTQCPHMPCLPYHVQI